MTILENIRVLLFVILGIINTATVEPLNAFFGLVFLLFIFFVLEFWA